MEIFDEKSFTKDERIAYATIPIPTQLFDGETVNEFYNLSGKQGLDQEGQGMARSWNDKDKSPYLDLCLYLNLFYQIFA